MTGMSKSTSRSRSSIFSTWSNKDKDNHQGQEKSRDRSPITPFSPSSTTSSPLPSTVPNSPLSDPFSCSIALPEPYRPSLSIVSPTFETHPSSSRYYSHSHTGNGQNTTKLVNGTEKTPKIVVASPSTGTIHYLFPDLPVSSRTASSVSEAIGEKRGSRLDPSSAKTIAKSIFKRQSKSVSDIRALSRLSEGGSESSTSTVRPRVVESFYIPHSQLSPGSRPDPLRPTKRVVSGASTAGSSTSKEARDGHEKHPLSMRTLRRQPSMADLTAGRRRGEALREALKENGDRVPMDRSNMVTKRQSTIWKTLDSRRESDTWRDLVDSMTRDQAPVSTELISPTDKTFPTIIHKEVAKSDTRDYDADNRRRSSSLSYTRPAGSILDQSPSIPCPDFGDPIDFSVAMAESPSYSHFDYSTAGSSTMSRSTTLSRTTRPRGTQPMSADMVRGDTRRGLGSYETAKMIARDDAAKRLAGEGPYAILRRSMSFKRDTTKNRKSTTRSRSQSLSAKSVRDAGISAPVPLPTANTGSTETVADKAKKRQSLGPSRGIYLGDLSVDLGGRYTPSSPASSEATSLYPASGGSAASYPRSPKIGNKPLHPALNGSETSILAPSTVGLGFSPISTPASLPASLEAEAIDLTGTYNHRPEPVSRSTSTSAQLPKRSTSLHRIKLEKAPLKAKPASPAPKPKTLRASDQEAELVTEAESAPEAAPQPRRSFLLAQNTFFIPPLAVPPSLRSSRSLSTLRLPNQPTSPGSTDLLPPAPVISNLSPDTNDRRPRNGGFNLCSPSDAIDPLPHGDTVSPSSNISRSGSGMQRKKSSPFLTASASIRGMFRQNSNSIARTLSHAFDKNPQSPVGRSGTASELVNASPGEVDGEREWREGLLREAVTTSFSKTDVSTAHMAAPRPPKRMPIPLQLLEAAHVTEADEEVSLHGGMEVEVEAESEEQGMEDDTLYSPSQILSASADTSRVTSPVQKSRKKNRPPTPTSGRVAETTQKNMISPPLPLFADLSRLGPSMSAHAPNAPPPYALNSPISVPQSVPMERAPVPVAGTVKLAPRRTSVSTSLGISLRSLTLRPKKSKQRLNLPQPISSSTRLPPRPLLDELTALEQQASLSSMAPAAEDKARKVLEWRSEVLENGDLAALEEKMTKHVEREKEWMKMKKREVVAH